MYMLQRTSLPDKKKWGLDLENLRHRHRIGRYRLAKECGMTYPTLKLILEGKSFKLDNLKVVEDAIIRIVEKS